jgi:hypothetical protein
MQNKTKPQHKKHHTISECSHSEAKKQFLEQDGVRDLSNGMVM